MLTRQTAFSHPLELPLRELQGVWPHSLQSNANLKTENIQELGLSAIQQRLDQVGWCVLADLQS